MPAEHELKSRIGGLGESLGAVREQDRAFVWRNAGPGLGEVMGFVEMRIVDPADPKPRAVPLESERLVEQYRQSDFFEFGNHLEKIMVAENAEADGRERRANPLQFAQAGSVVAFHPISKIACEDCRIVRRGLHEFFDHRRQFDIQIAVKVAELKQAEAVEGAWQRPKPPLLPHDLNIQKPPPQGLADSEYSKNPTEQGIKRNQTLQPKYPLALVQKFRALDGLALQAFLKQTCAEPGTELLFLGSGQRSTRPSWPGFSPGLGT